MTKVRKKILRMQKFTTKLSIVLLISTILCMVLFTMSTVVNAADTDCLIALSGGVNDDNSVFVDVVVMRNSGISALKLRLDYDKDVFEYVDGYDMNGALDKLTFTKSGTETEVDDIRFLYGPGNTDDTTGLLMRIELRVKDGAKRGTHKVNLVCEQAINSANGSNADVSVEVRAAKVTLGANGSVAVDTDSAPLDLPMIVAIVAAVVLVAALVAVICVRINKKRKAAKSREGWTKV